MATIAKPKIAMMPEKFIVCRVETLTKSTSSDLIVGFQVSDNLSMVGCRFYSGLFPIESEYCE